MDHSGEQPASRYRYDCHGNTALIRMGCQLWWFHLWTTSSWGNHCHSLFLTSCSLWSVSNFCKLFDSSFPPKSLLSIFILNWSRCCWRLPDRKSNTRGFVYVYVCASECLLVKFHCQCKSCRHSTIITHCLTSFPVWIQTAGLSCMSHNFIVSVLVLATVQIKFIFVRVLACVVSETVYNFGPSWRSVWMDFVAFNEIRSIYEIRLSNKHPCPTVKTVTLWTIIAI